MFFVLRTIPARVGGQGRTPGISTGTGGLIWHSASQRIGPREEEPTGGYRQGQSVTPSPSKACWPGAILPRNVCPNASPETSIPRIERGPTNSGVPLRYSVSLPPPASLLPSPAFCSESEGQRTGQERVLLIVIPPETERGRAKRPMLQTTIGPKSCQIRNEMARIGNQMISNGDALTKGVRHLPSNLLCTK